MEPKILDFDRTLRIFKNTPNTKLIDGFLVLLEGNKCKEVINYICIKDFKNKIIYGLQEELKKELKHQEKIVFFKDINKLNENVRCLSKQKKLFLLKESIVFNKVKNYYNKRKNKFCGYKNCTNVQKNKKCSQCKKKYYCSRKHQKYHWNVKHRYECE